MNTEQLKELFKTHNDEYGQFERVQNPVHVRPDLCAFLTLDRLCPAPGRDMVTATGHDELFLGIDVEALARVATEDDIILLIRCGVSFDASYDCLAMFV